jgi:hypothetical protein
MKNALLEHGLALAAGVEQMMSQQQNGLGGRLPEAIKVAVGDGHFQPGLRQALELAFEPVDLQSKTWSNGKTFTYVAVASVIRRMNDCFNGAWDLEIIQHEWMWQVGQVIAHVRVRAGGVTKEAIGVAVLEQKPSQTGQLTFVDPGNDLKIAVADGFKKACTYLGVALDLYDGPKAAPQPADQAPAAAAGPGPSVAGTMGGTPAQAFQLHRLCEFFEQQNGYARPQWLGFFKLSSLDQITYDVAGAILGGSHPVMAAFTQQTGKAITGVRTSAAA